MTPIQKLLLTFMLIFGSRDVIGQDIQLRGGGRADSTIYYIDHTKQCVSYLDTILQRAIFSYVDSMPEFPGGIGALLSFFSKNFVYPKEQEIFQASIYLSFVVEDNGNLSNISVYKKPIGNRLSLVDKEAIRVFQLMPIWEIGKCEGKKVAVKMTMPINF